MQLHQQKCLPLKRKLPSWKHLVYIYNKVRQKELLTQTLKKKIVKTHLQDDMEITKDHPISITIKMIQN